MKKLRVAAYVRVSLESERMRHSLDAQAEYYQHLIKENVDWEYAGIYADAGISGTGTAKREEFLRMMRDCEEGKIDKIVVKSVSRFARNTVDLLESVRQLKKWNVSVWFEEQRIDSLKEEGELMLTLMALVAQAESENISENAKWAIRKGFQKGIGNTRNRVFGYRWTEGKLTVVPEEAKAVKQIYADFLSGMSQSKIAEKLTEEGIRTIHGRTFSVSAAGFILRNITYTGNMLLQKTFIRDPVSKKKQMNKGELPQYFVENSHEAIIDMGTFEAVQKIFEKRKKMKQFPYNHTGEKYVFTGMLVCGCCGRHYTRQKWNSGKGGIRRASWVCTGKKSEKWRRCTGKNISEEKLIKLCGMELGLAEFRENIFLKKVESVIAQNTGELIFNMKQERKSDESGKMDCEIILPLVQ